MELIIGLFQSGTGNFGALSSADIQRAVETLACHLKQEVVREGGGCSCKQTEVELKATVSQSMQIAWHISAAQPLPGTESVFVFFFSFAANAVQQPCS